MRASRRVSRLLIQLACMCVVVVLLWPMLPWTAGPKFVAQTSPFVAICASIATRGIGIGAGIGLGVAVLTSVRRRWFCRYACPTGLVVEGSARVGLNKTSWWGKCPPIGRYAALLTLVGASAGYPVLLWMDPLAIFSSPFGIRGAGDLLSGILAGTGLVVIIAVSLLWGTFWCSRLCPLGATQDLLALAGSRFTGRRAAPDRRNERMPVARRALLTGLVGGGLGLWARKTGAARGQDAPLRPPGAVAEERFAGVCIRCGNCVRACPSKIIRPDTGEAGFAGLLAPVIRYDRPRYCLENCNACTQVCPSGALQALDLPRKRQYIIGEALVDVSTCLLTLGKKDCDACLRVCPFEAIRIVWDENAYVAYPAIDPKKCNGCGACEVVCPTTRVKAIRVWRV